MKSVNDKLVSENCNKSCFELFGYDLMVDTNKKVWLIEVNTNPCLEESSNLLKSYIPRMLDDLFKLTIDTWFRWKKEHEEPDSQPPLNIKGYSNSENLWEQIYDFHSD